jgi:hypothetical protein
MNPRARGGVAARVDSSLIQGALYWPEHRALELKLNGGRRYLYLGVPAEVAEEFARATSKGSFYNESIKGRFDCHALRDEPRQRAMND